MNPVGASTVARRSGLRPVAPARPGRRGGLLCLASPPRHEFLISPRPAVLAPPKVPGSLTGDQSTADPANRAGGDRVGVRGKSLDVSLSHGDASIISATLAASITPDR